MDFQPSCQSMEGRSMGILSQISPNRPKSNCKRLHIYGGNLKTFLCEVEAVLNGRPLASISDDISNFEPLTPNHLRIGEASRNQSPGNFREHEVNLGRN